MKDIKELEKTLLWELKYYSYAHKDKRINVVKTSEMKEIIKDLFKQFKEAQK